MRVIVVWLLASTPVYELVIEGKCLHSLSGGGVQHPSMDRALCPPLLGASHCQDGGDKVTQGHPCPSLVPLGRGWLSWGSHSLSPWRSTARGKSCTTLGGSGPVTQTWWAELLARAAPISPKIQRRERFPALAPHTLSTIHALWQPQWVCAKGMCLSRW